MLGVLPNAKLQRKGFRVLVEYKPIFHQNAKYLASGIGVGQCTRRQDFTLPNAKYTNMLVYFALCWYLKMLKFVFPPTQNPNASQWNIGCVGCQRNIFASSMYISCFLCTFHLRRAPNANPFFGGIWAIGLTQILYKFLLLCLIRSNGKPRTNHRVC